MLYSLTFHVTGRDQKGGPHTHIWNRHPLASSKIIVGSQKTESMKLDHMKDKLYCKIKDLFRFSYYHLMDKQVFNLREWNIIVIGEVISVNVIVPRIKYISLVETFQTILGQSRRQLTCMNYFIEYVYFHLKQFENFTNPFSIIDFLLVSGQIRISYFCPNARYPAGLMTGQ